MIATGTLRPNIYPEGVKVHKKTQCRGQFCCFHKPSKHAMRGWPMLVRLDLMKFPLVERLCDHRVGHPDPDSVAYLERTRPHLDWRTHGCCGCCQKEKKP